MELREATTATIKLGPFLSQTDGYNVKTALTPTVKVSKNGGALAARNSGTAIAHDADGYYTVELNATDTNTRGRLRVTATDANNHVPVWDDFDVLAAGAWDAKYSALLALQAAGNTTATLDAGASAVDNFYTGQQIQIVGGTGAGQTRRIIGYVGSTKVATLDLAWATNPIAGSTFQILAGASSALSAVERDAVADALLDKSNGVETGLTCRNALRLMAAALAGKVSGASAGASTVVFRNAVADNKNRITATTDAFGNRTAITPDLT